MHCSTIIVSYDTFDLTAEAVRSALRAADGLSHEVIVVDNASPDESAARLREAFPATDYPDVHVIGNTENVGFSRANNQGAAAARGEVLFFLNPDTVVDPGAVATLYRFLHTHPEAGAVGPHVSNADGTDQVTTSSFPSLARLLRHHLPVADLLTGRTQRTDPVPAATQPVDVLSGCALALRRDAFDAVGGWDESYFMYSEETELCYALQRAGYTNYFLREAHILHYGGASSRSNYAAQQVVQQRSATQFLRRHHGPGLLVVNRVLGTLGYGVRALLFTLLARLRPEESADYARRRAAAATLFRWYVRDYS